MPIVGPEEEADKELLAGLENKIKEEKEKMSEEDKDMLFKQYPMLEDYKDEDKDALFKKGDIVEVLDTENPEKWLVRKADEKDKVRER